MPFGLLTSVFRYAFVITLFWLGFVVAISFVETPIRFQIDTLEQADVLSIGHRLFHVLNYAEIVFAILVGCSLVVVRHKSLCNGVGVAVLLILVFQTGLLFGVLDQRTLAKIAGQQLPDSPWHQFYVGLELAKVMFLIALATLQIRQFSRSVELNHSTSN